MPLDSQVFGYTDEEVVYQDKCSLEVLWKVCLASGLPVESIPKSRKSLRSPLVSKLIRHAFRRHAGSSRGILPERGLLNDAKMSDPFA
jgi:hypothetical protein